MIGEGAVFRSSFSCTLQHSLSNLRQDIEQPGPTANLFSYHFERAREKSPPARYSRLQPRPSPFSCHPTPSCLVGGGSRQ